MVNFNWYFLLFYLMLIIFDVDSWVIRIDFVVAASWFLFIWFLFLLRKVLVIWNFYELCIKWSLLSFLNFIIAGCRLYILWRSRKDWSGLSKATLKSRIKSREMSYSKVALLGKRIREIDMWWVDSLISESIVVRELLELMKIELWEA